MQTDDHNIENSDAPQPVLGYATVAAALKNPVSVAAVVCAGMPFGLMGAASWLPGMHWAYAAGPALFQFGFLAIIFGLIGVWLTSDRRHVVVGRAMGWIAAAAGAFEMALGQMMAGLN